MLPAIAQRSSDTTRLHPIRHYASSTLQIRIWLEIVELNFQVLPCPPLPACIPKRVNRKLERIDLNLCIQRHVQSLTTSRVLWNEGSRLDSQRLRSNQCTWLCTARDQAQEMWAETTRKKAQTSLHSTNDAIVREIRRLCVSSSLAPSSAVSHRRCWCEMA